MLPNAIRIRVRRARSWMLRSDYPARVAVSGPDVATVNMIREHGCRTIAEIGCYQGDTSVEIAKVLDGDGELHLFDFEERVDKAAGRVRDLGFANVITHGNTHRTFDSYTWPLLKLLRDRPELRFDYVFIDGSHTWQHDAFAFLLVDRMLAPGGFVDFDDLDWSLARSPSLNPDVFPATRRQYTEEQIRVQHVQLIVDVLVRRDLAYREVLPGKVFQKDQ